MTAIAVVAGVGASRGLGAALARRFAAGGLHAHLVGRTEEKLAAVAAEIEATGGAASHCVADLTVPTAVEAAFRAIDGRGEVRSVLFNAGSNLPISFASLTPESFESFWRIGCFAGFLVARQALPRLAGVEGASLLFTGASASRRGKPGFAHFAVAKAGLRVLAQALAREHGPQGVHVAHVIVDGVIDGERVRSILPDYVDGLGPDGALDPDHVAETFWQLHLQPRDAWTHELEVRPFAETW